MRSLGKGILQFIIFSLHVNALGHAKPAPRTISKRILSLSATVVNNATSSNCPAPDFSRSGKTNVTCCGPCSYWGFGVEIYYWPDPLADTSCLSIIGPDNLPVDYGATTDAAGEVYWGCTDPNDPQKNLTTATLAYRPRPATVDVHRGVRVQVLDPAQCKLATSSTSNDPIVMAASHAYLYDGRGQSSSAPISKPPGDTAPLSVVLDGHTLFSPSIYAMLQGGQAQDECGFRPITSNLLSFAPGELSTYVLRQLSMSIPDGFIPGGYVDSARVRIFNARDLPCPPQSVMEEAMWRPEYGHPYRPWILFPSTLSGVHPFLSSCPMRKGLAYDPPTALTPAVALVPTPTPTDPTSASEKPAPSQTPDPGPDQTGKSTPPLTLAPSQSVPVNNEDAADGSVHDTQHQDPSNQASAADPSSPKLDTQQGSNPADDQTPQPDGDPHVFITKGTGGESGITESRPAFKPAGAAAAPYPRPLPVLTFDGSSYTANSAGQFVISSHTLTPGAAITISNTPISIAPNGDTAVIGKSIQKLRQSDETTVPVLAFDSSTYTADASSRFTINGQTLTPGGHITVSGTPLSYPALGTAIVIGSSTSVLHYATVTPFAAATMTFNGSTYTADASSDFVIAGQTLTPGGVITVSGTPISYAAAGTDVVVGSSTEAVGLGGLVMSGFGSGGGGAAAKTSGGEFTGGAVSWRGASKGLLICNCILSVLVLL